MVNGPTSSRHQSRSSVESTTPHPCCIPNNIFHLFPETQIIPSVAHKHCTGKWTTPLPCGPHDIDFPPHGHMAPLVCGRDIKLEATSRSVSRRRCSVRDLT